MGFPLLMTVVMRGPVSFSLVPDLPDPEPCAPGEARCCLVSSSGRTASCVVFRRVPGGSMQIPFGVPRDALLSHSTGADLAEETKFCVFFKKRKKAVTICLVTGIHCR